MSSVKQERSDLIRDIDKGFKSILQPVKADPPEATPVVSLQGVPVLRISLRSYCSDPNTLGPPWVRA